MLKIYYSHKKNNLCRGLLNKNAIFQGAIVLDYFVES